MRLFRDTAATALMVASLWMLVDAENYAVAPMGGMFDEDEEGEWVATFPSWHACVTDQRAALMRMQASVPAVATKMPGLLHYVQENMERLRGAECQPYNPDHQ